ncbi:MAG: hypothetical protein PHU23_18395, partial [Dehalococcoidales bacterium]|nr:hypothetical protein [Dehalococcoidales bacterium]
LTFFESLRRLRGKEVRILQGDSHGRDAAERDGVRYIKAGGHVIVLLICYTSIPAIRALRTQPD